MGDMLSPAPAARPTATRSSSPWKSSATPATFVSPSAAGHKKTVVLFDWWLIKAEPAFEGKILAVSGFTTRQHATRIFCSAPIVKRHDAYTLEAADGITVLLQGMINKARLQENAFPLEAYNHFLIGFPYNWSHYAEEYFKKRTTTNLSSLDEASKDSTEGTGSAFPIHLHEFPISKLLNLPSFSWDKLTTNFSDHLKKFFMSSSTDSEMQKFSLPSVDDNCKQDTDKNDRNISGSAVSVEPHVEDSTTACCRHIECSNLDVSEGLTVSKEGIVGMLKKSSGTNMTETDMDNHSHSFFDLDENIHVQNSLKLNIDTEHPTNSIDARNSTLNSQLLEGADVSHPSSIFGDENVRNRTMSYGTEEQSPIVQENSYPSIGICTRSGRILCTPSSFCRSLRSKDKSASLYKMKSTKVPKEYETANTMTETPNEKPSNISFEEKRLTYDSEDHASTLDTHQDLATLSDKCSSDLSVKLLCTDPLKCSHQISSASSHATTKELKKQNGLSIDHAVVGNNTCKNGPDKNSTKGSTQSNPPAVAQSNKVKTIKLIGKNMVKKANNQDPKETAVLHGGPSKNKELHINGRRKLLTPSPTTYFHPSPVTRGKAERFSMASPGSLNLRRSRSGRLIVPPLDSGCQQIVYDADGSITGITNVDMLSSLSRGSMSEPRKRRKTP